MNTERPPVRFSTSASGVVRASRIMRSDWRTREMKTFWPVTTYRRPPPLGEGANAGGVGAGVGFGYGEGLQPEFAGRDPGEKTPLLLLRAMPQHGPHRVHLRVAGGGVGSGAVDLLQDDAGLADPQPHPPVLLGDQARQVARLGQRVDELVRVGAGFIRCPPVVVVEAGAERPDARPELIVEGCHP